MKIKEELIVDEIKEANTTIKLIFSTIYFTLNVCDCNLVNVII